MRFTASKNAGQGAENGAQRQVRPANQDQDQQGKKQSCGNPDSRKMVATAGWNRQEFSKCCGHGLELAFLRGPLPPGPAVSSLRSHYWHTAQEDT